MRHLALHVDEAQLPHRHVGVHVVVLVEFAHLQIGSDGRDHEGGSEAGDDVNEGVIT